MCSKRDFRFYSYANFVLAIFLSKVLINKLQPVQALCACLLEDKINVHTLRYHVQKEREKQEGKENADSRQGSVIFINNNESSGKEFSPLTVESDGATRAEDKDLQVQQLLAQKGAFSASSLECV